MQVLTSAHKLALLSWWSQSSPLPPAPCSKVLNPTVSQHTPTRLRLACCSPAGERSSRPRPTPAASSATRLGVGR